MAREVVWTDLAWEDLEAAAEYFARDSEAYAASFVEEIKGAATSLSEMAERGQIVPEIGDVSIRELLVRPYRLVDRTASQDPRDHPRGETGVAKCLSG
jgi:plasmid stabilization system protein ParE